MLKSTIKNITLVCSSLVTALILSQTANAQQQGLNVGAPVKIPQGLEKQYLQYQLQNNGAGLRQMRVMPACVVGEGLRCGKTGTVLEKIIESNGGLTYQQMLMKAAGGEDNFNKFATYYGNNRNLMEQPIPYTSLWRNGSNRFLDSVTYTLGEPLSRNRVAGLGDVTSKFYWSPLRGQDPYRAFADMKYAFGRVMVEEAAKIPDLKQQIIQMNLEPEVMRFYQNNIARAISAMNGGRDEEFKASILRLLSQPYSQVDINNGDYGRVVLDEMPGGLVDSGDVLTGNIFDDSVIEPLGNVITDDISVLDGSQYFSTASDGFGGILPWLVPLALLALLLGSIGDRNGSSSRAVAQSVPEIPGIPTPQLPDNVCPDLNIGGGGSGNSGQVGEVQCDIPITQPPEVKKVVEPSVLKAMILLTLILCLVNYKKRRRQQLT
ncbi:hypothetical protein [Anabaena sp. CCY 9402-a]|uniref:hypothetical protein n=1 Tax=Anabaena sp. CCY 9402-a TaxID=3103867 RepID=UPI0039C6A3DE